MRTVLALGFAAALLLPATAASAETPAEKAMAQHIGSQLKESGQLRNYRIGVEYADGVAKLTGTVTSSQQREIARRLTQQIDGVEHVVCKLNVPGEAIGKAAGTPPNLFNAAEGAQPAPRFAGPASQATSARSLPRNNMPLPSRLANGSAGPGIRQASAQQGVYPANASYPAGYAPGAMGPGFADGGAGAGMEAVPVGFVPHGMGRGPSYENAQLPGYAWPTYASYPNYAALTYPQQYSPTAWPYIGPFYPYPQVPLAWRKVSLEWDDGWWFLDFSAHNSSH
jgi:hypothetical protein